MVDESPAIWATVYDCGGRGGIHRSWKGFPTFLNYVSFEPESDAFGELSTMVAACSASDKLRFSVEKLALSEKPVVRTLNVYSSPDLSSFLEFDQGLTHRYRYPDIHLVDRIDIECDTLDNVSARRHESPDFLCLDTQGTELMVLRGAERILKHSVIGLRCEVEFIPLYQNQPLFDQVWRFLAERGFRLVRFEKCGSGVTGISTDAGPFSLSVDDAAPAWADAILVREPDFLYSSTSGGQGGADKLMKFVLFTIANSCGSIGLDLMWQLSLEDQLPSVLQALDQSDLEVLISSVVRHLDLSDHSGWQADPQYLTWFRRDRAHLRKELAMIVKQRGLKNIL